MNPNAAAFALILKQRQQSSNTTLNFKQKESTPYQKVKLMNNNSDILLNSERMLSLKSEGSRPSFYCEPCDKEFALEKDLGIHLKSHEACKKDGCNFSGSKKALLTHFHIVHGQYSGSGFKAIDIDGQKFKVLLGTSPDEVNKWRESRKVNFPTINKVAMKQQNKDNVSTSGGILPPTKTANNKCSHKRKIDSVADNSQADKRPRDNESANSRLFLPKPLNGGTRGTLLKSLLASEVTAEENIVLQCLRFLVTSDFLLKNNVPSHQ